MLKNILYAITCLTFTIVIGGAVYEHLAVVPQWSAAPPASLSMFQGEYGLNPAPFWLMIHPVNVILFTIILIMHWRTERRKHIMTAFFSYMGILAITFVYFVPELMAITSTPFSLSVDPSLASRGSLWEMLSIIRLFILIGLAVTLFLGLTKEKQSIKKASAKKASIELATA